MSKKITNYYGEGGRLKQAPAEALINSAYQHDCDQSKYLLEDLHVANLAYASMLVKQEIIPLTNGKDLISELLKLVEEDIEIEIDPKYGDIYNCVDVYLKSKLKDTAGWLHAGRPRREAVNIAFLLKTRTCFLDTYHGLLNTAKALKGLAAKHLDTIMPDYTYLHHAQPTSLGHYLLTFLNPLLRDLERFEASYANLNSSPAGSGSVNGSRLPLDKPMLKDLLGFDSISEHSRDAMWQPDIPIQVIGDLINAFTNLSRLCEEWIIWNTAEFALIELPDKYCRASVIMPQKKNPYPLTYIRGLCGHFIGAFPSFASVGKVSSGNPDSRIFIYDTLPDALAKASSALTLFSELCNEVSFNKELMLSRISKGFGMATDISDFLILKRHCDYRTAHHIVGKVIRSLVEDGKTGADISASLLNSVAAEFGISDLNINAEELADLVQPGSIVASRQTMGGAAKEQMEKMLKDIEQKLEKHNMWITSKEKANAEYKTTLIKIAKQIIN